MALISSASKSGRLLASRRYTHETLTDAQESFTNVLDLQASETYTQAAYIPSSSLPFSGSSQINLSHRVSGSNVFKYWHRHKLTKSNTNNETWFFLNPSGSDNGIGAQLIHDDQEVNFISPKYSIAGLATSTTADSTPGYLATLYKSSAVSHSTQTGSLDGDDIVSTNDYIFDYKTGVVEFKNSSLDPTNSEYLYMTVYQYTGTTLATGIDVRGNITGSDIYSTGTLDIDGATTLNGTVTLGNATSDTITATGRFNTDIVPSTDSARDLGTSALQFAEAHIDTGYIDSLTTTTNVDIDDSGGDGAMDGVIIGAATAAAGTFTTLNTTGLTTIGDASGDSLVINAATINPANIAAGTDNTVVVYNGSTLLTDEIDSRVWGSTLVDTDGSGANNELATWSDSNTVIGEGNLTFDGSTLGVTGGITSTGNIITEGDVIAENYIVSSSVTYMTSSFSSGSTQFGDTVSDTHKFTGSLDITGSITPGEDNKFDLGSATLEWKDLYIDGTANIDSLSAGTAAIGDLTSGRVVIAGGSGELQDDSDLTFSGDTLTATKIGAFEAAGAIDFSDEAMTNVDINSGAIDGTAIGANTHTSIKGTTIDATTDFTIDGLVITANTITYDEAGTGVTDVDAEDEYLEPDNDHYKATQKAIGKTNKELRELGLDKSDWSDWTTEEQETYQKEMNKLNNTEDVNYSFYKGNKGTTNLTFNEHFKDVEATNPTLSKIPSMRFLIAAGRTLKENLTTDYGTGKYGGVEGSGSSQAIDQGGWLGRVFNSDGTVNENLTESEINDLYNQAQAELPFIIGNTDPQESMVNKYFSNMGSNLGVSSAYMDTYNAAKNKISQTLNLTPNTQQYGYGNTFNQNFDRSMTSANPFFDELTNQGLI